MIRKIGFHLNFMLHTQLINWLIYCIWHTFLQHCEHTGLKVENNENRKDDECIQSNFLLIYFLLKTIKIITKDVLLFAKLANVRPGEKGKPFGSTTEAKLQWKNTKLMLEEHKFLETLNYLNKINLLNLTVKQKEARLPIRKSHFKSVFNCVHARSCVCQK